MHSTNRKLIYTVFLTLNQVVPVQLRVIKEATAEVTNIFLEDLPSPSEGH